MMLRTLVAMLAWMLLLAPGGRPGIAVTAVAVAVLVGAVAVGLACAAWLGLAAALIPLTGRAAALREKSWSAAFLRQRDPDAAGRPRPRAPSAAPAAA
jgi:hypothetical protein